MSTMPGLFKLLRDSFASVGMERMSTRLGIALLVVSSIFFAANFADKAWMSYQVAQERHHYVLQIEQVRQQIAQYSSDLKYMRTRPYYVQAARAYGYVQPGDVPVSIQQAPQLAAPPQVTRGAVPPAPQHKSLLRRFVEMVVPGL